MSAGGLDSDPIYFDVSENGDVAVATFHAPRLTDEENVEQLGHDLVGIVEKQQCSKVVLDLGSVQYATSSVIGKWIMLHRKLARENGRLAICCVQPALGDILKAAHLLDYFNAKPDVATAVAFLSETDDQTQSEAGA